MGGEVVARVGGETIDRELVQEVAAAQRLSPRAAADMLIADALAAAGAREVGADKDPEVAWAIEAARARQVANRIRAAAVAKGGASDAEVVELTARHWQELDLPERVRVVHAVVRYPASRSAEADARAKTVFEAIVRAVQGASDANAFQERAKEVPHPGVTVAVEALPSFVADGRAAEGNGQFDEAFVAAAFRLRVPGAQTQVETRFGWHVLQLVERLAPKAVPFEERRAMFAEEAVALRARKDYDALLAALRQKYPVEVSGAADNLMKPLNVP